MPSQTPTEPSPARLHLVLLEDEAVLQRALARVARHHGVRVTFVDDADALRAELGWTGGQVAVIDFHLAGRDATRLVEQLEQRGVPVVVWTADPDTAAEQLGPHTPIVAKTDGAPRLFDEVRRARAAATNPLALAAGLPRPDPSSGTC